MARYTCIEAFKANHPTYNKAYHFVGISSIGEIHEHVFPIDDFHNEIKPLMTSYCYVNGWHTYCHEIDIV